jgi:chlorobactene glucosyltransferase
MEPVADVMQFGITIISHLTAFFLLLILSFQLVANLRFLRWVRRQAANTPLPQPRVSVLIPARNEAATITPCVTSLLHQDYPDYEVIVLNDGSTDSTGAQLDALADQHARLKVIHAQDQLPAAWNGKSYACHRLAEQATGEWLLFTDADTQHSPQSVALGLAQAQTLDVDLLSAFPTQITQTWSERILVSFILDFLPLVGLNFRAISMGKGSRSAGNGQYLLARAISYRRAGGHAAVYNETLDDFAIAKHFRRGGYKVGLVDGKELLHCRMYRNAREVWEGFSRSMMHGLDNSTLERHSWLWALLFAWSYAALFLHPFYYLLLGGNPTLALVEIAWLALLRGVATWHLHRSPLEILTTPLAAWGVMALGMTALYRRWQGQKVNWKGRYYTG